MHHAALVSKLLFLTVFTPTVLIKLIYLSTIIYQDLLNAVLNVVAVSVSVLEPSPRCDRYILGFC